MARSTNSGSAWADISGATSSSYTTSSVTAAMSGYKYRCKITNSVGSVTSNAVTLTVNVIEPILMKETTQNTSTNFYVLGASRYTGNFDLTSVKRDTNILTITILDTSTDTIPANYVASWDVSRDNNGSVTAWLVQDTVNTTMYHMYIGAEDGVKAMSGYYLFYNYSQCTNMYLDKLNTSIVTDMSYMFYGCSKLTSLDVSNFDTSLVTSMYMMFYNCYSLTGLELSNFNTSNVTSMSYMFGSCSKVTSLDLSNFNTSKTTSMTCMFQNCSGLTKLYLGDNFDRINGSSMFSGTTKLTTIISTRTTPMTIGTGDNGLKTSNTKAVIYVPNATVETNYEEDSS